MKKSGYQTISKNICRFCNAHLTVSLVDLGVSPLANSFVAMDEETQAEQFYPLHVFVCSGCRLVQIQQFESPEAIFGDYIYFSSFSDTWLLHAEAYADEMVQRFGFGSSTCVVEVASNDGYLLQYFQRRGIAVLGIEPAANVAAAAIAKGIPTEIAFFGANTAARLRTQAVVPDLIVANNVLAHVPDINDFIAGFAVLLPMDGVVTFEFPHLLHLIRDVLFDTIYHEHFSYLSLHVVQRILARHDLRVFDVEKLTTHGGSLRVFACHVTSVRHQTASTVSAVLAEEVGAGLERDAPYSAFAEAVIDRKCALLRFLIDAREAGRVVVGYGAPAKANTLLNYCGVGPELVPFTVDRSPHKQGTLLPGTRIPVRAPDAILQTRPDYVIILAWNLKDEIMTQMAAIREWGGQFVVPLPTLQILP